VEEKRNLVIHLQLQTQGLTAFILKERERENMKNRSSEPMCPALSGLGHFRTVSFPSQGTWSQLAGLWNPKTESFLASQQLYPAAPWPSPCHKTNILSYTQKCYGYPSDHHEKKRKKIKRLMNIQRKQKRWLVRKLSSTINSAMLRIYKWNYQDAWKEGHMGGLGQLGDCLPLRSWS